MNPGDDGYEQESLKAIAYFENELALLRRKLLEHRTLGSKIALGDIVKYEKDPNSLYKVVRIDLVSGGKPWVQAQHRVMDWEDWSEDAVWLKDAWKKA
jgi:hypothetical protein